MLTCAIFIRDQPAAAVVPRGNIDVKKQDLSRLELACENEQKRIYYCLVQVPQAQYWFSLYAAARWSGQGENFLHWPGIVRQYAGQVLPEPLFSRRFSSGMPNSSPASMTARHALLISSSPLEHLSDGG